MNIPKSIQTYCRKCKKHTAHKLKQFKPAAPRAMSIGTRRMQRKHKSGYGGKTKHPATVKKQTKKPTFVAECAVCRQKHYFWINKKMKKVELV